MKVLQSFKKGVAHILCCTPNNCREGYDQFSPNSKTNLALSGVHVSRDNMLFESSAIVKCLKNHFTEVIVPHRLCNENALKILLELVVSKQDLCNDGNAL
ncbi:hypothetical protein E2C01_061064 [Portunus trituberculatus]|uniref:Uncharacterized protein n=1 Tax=Portunus trituberculatus TaxID=210409 RepID=A0A5B7HAQ7_PORTR|nr:hypothetical protein [Portunus trituberculatus]